MNDNLTTTQKIRLDLQAEIEKTDQAIAEHLTLDNLEQARFLKKKQEFYGSKWHQAYKDANAQLPPVQFERRPDEGLL